MTANNNIIGIAEAIAEKHLKAHVTEIAAEALTMGILLKRADDVVNIGNGFRECGSHEIAAKLYDGAKLIYDAIMLMGDDIDRKQKEAEAQSPK